MLARCRPYFTQQTGGLTRGLTLREIQQAGRKSIKDLSWVEDFRLALSTEDLALTTVRASALPISSPTAHTTSRVTSRRSILREILYRKSTQSCGWRANMQTQLKHLCCGCDPEEYANFLIPPIGQIDRNLIASEKANIDRIVATLGLKEMSQSVLVRKLCTLSGHHRTRKAIFEFDKLIRSIYTLHYLRDPQLQRNVHRSQNRIEAYHQLRSALAQVSGRKELIGHTDLDVAISNECGRLVANIVIACNSILLCAPQRRRSPVEEDSTHVDVG